MSNIVRSEAILDYINLCEIVDSTVIYNKFFKIEGANPRTRRDACGRFLSKMFQRGELYRVRSANSLNYLYSIKPFSKNKSLSTYSRMALESSIIYYFEIMGYVCLSIRRNFTLQKGMKLPCILWMKYGEIDEFYFVEIANTTEALSRILDQYTYINSSKLYMDAFHKMPTLILKTDCYLSEALIKIIRVPYTLKEW